jgi:predicted DNA-binding transcriptional regulator YafY
VLRQGDPARPAAEDASDHYHGALATALDRLLHQAGLADEARAIAPDAVTVSRFGVAAEEDAAFPICFAAIRAGESLRCSYTKQNGETRPIHIAPIRLVHIAGEWFCFAWSADRTTPPGRVKQYRLSGMHTPVRSTTPVPGRPVIGLRQEVTGILRDAFRATGSTDPKRRRRVSLALSPIAWHFLRDRRWGADQRVAGPGIDGLPADWRRIEFVTTGLEECRHFVLSLGSEARAEGPPELIAWLRGQGAWLSETYGSK